MKWFREPSGKFVIKIPTEWRYANVAVDYEEKSPFSFQSYENPNWSFQVSCYSDEEKSFNQRVTKQKFNTPKLEFKEFRMDGDGFNIHIWGATVENNTLMAKYIYDTGKESDTDILIELGRVKEALSTIQLLSPDKRTICFELDKYEKFMAALVASFDLKNNALKNESFIEFSIIVANQILYYLSSNKKRLEKEYHLVKIGIFGSIARGEQNEKSDIDLIVEFEENTPDLYSIKQSLKDEIQSRFNLPVDICREKYIKPVFKNQILSDAKYA
jgi:predicted nucleotidyltransferase